MSNELFMSLAIHRGQLDDIYESLQQTILENIKHDKDDKERNTYPYNRPKKVMVQLSVTNISKTGEQKLVVEELNRLRSFVVSLGETIKYMQELSRPQSYGSTDIVQDNNHR